MFFPVQGCNSVGFYSSCRPTLRVLPTKRRLSRQGTAPSRHTHSEPWVRVQMLLYKRSHSKWNDSSFCRVLSGIRTHDSQNHNLVLYR